MSMIEIAVKHNLNGFAELLTTSNRQSLNHLIYFKGIVTARFILDIQPLTG